MAVGGRGVVLAVTADGEVDLIRGMVDLLRPLLDRVVIAEATRTFQGAPREVRSDRWAADLRLSDGMLRTVVTDLPAVGETDQDKRRRERLQRAAIGLAVRDVPPTDLLVAVDADEYVDPQWLIANAAAITVPTRLTMVPTYGGLDRRAPDWHCCRSHLTIPIGQWPPEPTGWLYPGGVVGPISALAGRGVGAWRYLPDQMAGPAGWHLLHILAPFDDTARKLGRQSHTWDPRVDTRYMSEVLAAGVHPYGWWAATTMPVPPQLGYLVARHPQVVRGPLPPAEVREALLQAALRRFAGLSANHS